MKHSERWGEGGGERRGGGRVSQGRRGREAGHASVIAIFTVGYFLINYLPLNFTGI